jgi:hypothetical protein
MTGDRRSNGPLRPIQQEGPSGVLRIDAVEVRDTDLLVEWSAEIHCAPWLPEPEDGATVRFESLAVTDDIGTEYEPGEGYARYEECTRGWSTFSPRPPRDARRLRLCTSGAAYHVHLNPSHR